MTPPPAATSATGTPLEIDPAHPRPRLARADWLSLDGPWAYEIIPAGGGIPRASGTIIVPFCLESSLSGVGGRLLPGERLVYRRRFVPPESWSGRAVLLHFGAVDWRAEVSFNGRVLGAHEGGYLPFSFELEGFRPAAEGGDELLVVVEDPTDAGLQARGKQSLSPEGCFYTACSGIWQTVWLEPVPRARIEDLLVECLPDLATVDIHVRAESPRPWRARVLAEGRPVAEGEARGGASLRLAIPGARTWSPEDPFLYGLEISTEGGDLVTSYFGLRSFGLGMDGRGHPCLTLNGKPRFLHGVLDQGYFPDGVYTAPSDAALAADLEAAKSLGFTMVRKHAKVEPARWYWHAARLGLVVWQDMPAGGSLLRPGLRDLAASVLGHGLRDTTDRGRRLRGRGDAAGRAAFEAELAALVDTLRGETAIGAWVPFNEGWGQFDSLRIAADVKRRDPGRIVDHASGWFDQGGGELHSVHRYVLRARKPRGGRGRPFALTEYGGYNHAVPGHAGGWGKPFGYKYYDDLASLRAGLGRLFRRELLPLRRKGLAAAVYTQLTDVERETNGLITYDREVLKVEEAEFREWGRALEAGYGHRDPEPRDSSRKLVL